MIAAEPIEKERPAVVPCEALEAIASEMLKGVTVKRFGEIISWAAAQPGVPPNAANALRVAGWFAEATAFREAEERLLSEGTHRPCLAGLIGAGENLVWAAEKFGMAASGSPPFPTLEDLKATLDSLQTTFRCEHGPKNSEKTNELIGQLLDGSQP
jgi:hypothetical protein